MAVERDGVTSNHHELSTGIAELDEHVPEIVRKLDHLRCPGTKRYGVSAREYLGMGRPDSDQLARVRRVTSVMAGAPLSGEASRS
jgi:hypothetical protein